jgi:hypothetical protein
MKDYLNYEQAIKRIGETNERDVILAIEEAVDGICNVIDRYDVKPLFAIEDTNEWIGVRIVNEADEKIYSFDVFGGPKNKMSMALKYLARIPYLDAD